MDSEKPDTIVLVSSLRRKARPLPVGEGRLQKPLRRRRSWSTESGVAFGRVVGFVLAIDGGNGRLREPPS
jgi:hypothetical protein